MKFRYIILFISFILTSSNLMAQVQKDEKNKQVAYGQKGIIELFGSLSLNGNSTNPSLVSFSAVPGFNYFITDNFYMGPRLHVGVTRNKYKKQYAQSQYLFHDYYKTTVNLGLGVPLGFVYRMNDHVYFNLEAPELNFQLNDLKHFRLYPNLITALKFPFDNSVVDIGIQHNFFYITDKNISNLYYSYHVFFSFSAFFDTVKKEGSVGTDNRMVPDNSAEAIELISPARARGKIAGAFFMSWLPVYSGSWLAGWDWGGFAFAFLKSLGVGCIIATICANVPSWVMWAGIVAWPSMTLADMIYSPCMVAYHYRDVLKNSDNSEKSLKGHVKNQTPDVMFNAAPRLTLKNNNKMNNNKSPSNYKMDGINVMIVHTL